MKEYIPILGRSRMFAGVEEEEITSLLGCLNARARSIAKGEFVLRQGERAGELAVLAAGELLIQSDDYWGNRSILGRIVPGEMFAEAYIGPESGPVLNDVVAIQDSTVLFFDAHRVLTTCSSACRFHAMVVQNLFYAVSEKNRELVQKLRHMSRRTTREKLISYLSQQAKSQGGPEFSIAFNRQQLADFLSVDRSAMSNELCNMRDEGLLEFKKIRFHLLNGAI